MSLRNYTNSPKHKNHVPKVRIRRFINIMSFTRLLQNKILQESNYYCNIGKINPFMHNAVKWTNIL